MMFRMQMGASIIASLFGREPVVIATTSSVNELLALAGSVVVEPYLKRGQTLLSIFIYILGSWLQATCWWWFYKTIIFMLSIGNSIFGFHFFLMETFLSGLMNIVFILIPNNSFFLILFQKIHIDVLKAYLAHRPMKSNTGHNKVMQ